MAMSQNSVKEALEREQQARIEAEAIRVFYENKWATQPKPTASPAAGYTQSENQRALELAHALAEGQKLLRVLKTA